MCQIKWIEFMKHIIFTILFALCIPSFLYANTKITKIVSVPDGDTITVINGRNQKVKIRLLGIDAPEISQRYGKEARDYLQKIMKGKNLSYKIKNKDDYGRTVAILYGDDEDLNYEMIKSGYAWHYKHFYKSKKYAQAEIEARKAKIGLWQDNNPQAPWDYRRENKGKNNDYYKINHYIKLAKKLVKHILEFFE